VWELWTTKDGLESWWGPDGFRVEVQSLDLRPGGQLVYLMIASDPDKVEFMKKAGMPVAVETRLTYTEIAPERLLVYRNLVDFVPGVAPYEASQRVELAAEGTAVRMVVTIDAMHDEEWTQRAVMGWEQELGKLERLLAARRR
jgi:uncharacterized protein YndB with AHSA1/START domain